jgi:hypothetical protein
VARPWGLALLRAYDTVVLLFDVEIQTDSNKNWFIKIQNCKKKKNRIFLNVFGCPFVKPLNRISDWFFKTDSNRTKPHAYILICIYLFISMISCIYLLYIRWFYFFFNTTYNISLIYYKLNFTSSLLFINGNIVNTGIMKYYWEILLVVLFIIVKDIYTIIMYKLFLWK